LRLGASTTISQYPPLLALSIKMRGIKVILRNGNTEQIENALLDKEIETVVEGQSKNKTIKYIPF
jgi:hypothetical protein